MLLIISIEKGSSVYPNGTRQKAHGRATSDDIVSGEMIDPDLSLPGLIPSRALEKLGRNYLI